MNNVVPIALAVMLSATAGTIQAQKPKPGTTKPVAQKFKPPKLTCMLGVHTDSATVVYEEGIQLINLPLRITDDKKNPYSVSSYQLMYKQAGVTEEERGDKTVVVPATRSLVQLFRETPITGIWKKTISEQLKPGDELYFFDIIVKDSQGRFMFAPDLRIRISK